MPHLWMKTKGKGSQLGQMYIIELYKFMDKGKSYFKEHTYGIGYFYTHIWGNSKLGVTLVLYMLVLVMMIWPILLWVYVWCSE